MAKPAKDIAASVRARLFNLSREREQDFQRVLVSYGLERLLYRLSISEHKDRYILKGGMLVTLWTIDPGRFTQDIDFLAFGHDDAERLLANFKEVLAQEVDDGLIFDLEEMSAAPIRDDQVYGGMRLKTTAYLKKTKIPIVIDLGFGDAIIGPDYEIEYGSLLDMPSATVRAYSPETVIAEKFQAVIALGIVNSRMKDYYDLYSIPRSVHVSDEALVKAIQSTFERRETEIPLARPSGLTPEFTQDLIRETQWAAYSAGTDVADMSLKEISDDIWARLKAICKSAKEREAH
ncbi:MAG: nucleotidyl transferase AbiEii/AbiGii toxin family protein [Maricaulaceae bacterium]